jgi:hypothetical protein
MAPAALASRPAARRRPVRPQPVVRVPTTPSRQRRVPPLSTRTPSRSLANPCRVTPCWPSRPHPLPLPCEAHLHAACMPLDPAAQTPQAPQGRPRDCSHAIPFRPPPLAAPLRAPSRRVFRPRPRLGPSAPARATLPVAWQCATLPLLLGAPSTRHARAAAGPPRPRPCGGGGGGPSQRRQRAAAANKCGAPAAPRPCQVRDLLSRLLNRYGAARESGSGQSGQQGSGGAWSAGGWGRRASSRPARPVAAVRHAAVGPRGARRLGGYCHAGSPGGHRRGGRGAWARRRRRRRTAQERPAAPHVAFPAAPKPHSTHPARLQRAWQPAKAGQGRRGARRVPRAHAEAPRCHRPRRAPRPSASRCPAASACGGGGRARWRRSP